MCALFRKHRRKREKHAENRIFKMVKDIYAYGASQLYIYLQIYLFTNNIIHKFLMKNINNKLIFFKKLQTGQSFFYHSCNLFQFQQKSKNERSQNQLNFKET